MVLRLPFDVGAPRIERVWQAVRLRHQLHEVGRRESSE
jgi:hypothetical protein